MLPDLVVFVADAGLGTIDSVLPSVAALAGLPVVVVLNRYLAGVELHRRNRDWLTGRCGVDVMTDAGSLADRLRPCLVADRRHTRFQ